MLIGEYKINLRDDSRKEYVYLNKTPIIAITAREIYTIYTDSFDTPRRLVNKNGDIVWRWDSKPFGESKPLGIVDLNLRFAGQYFDNETNHHYNINRNYNPITGRYIQSDPIGFAGGSMNTFTYVDGNPAISVDLEGLCDYSYTIITGMSATATGYGQSGVAEAGTFFSKVDNDSRYDGSYIGLYASGENGSGFTLSPGGISFSLTGTVGFFDGPFYKALVGPYTNTGGDVGGLIDVGMAYLRTLDGSVNGFTVDVGVGTPHVGGHLRVGLGGVSNVLTFRYGKWLSTRIHWNRL